ncbi:MAG: hypothetical protein ABI835_10880 [Chloroflexota bacterium]
MIDGDIHAAKLVDIPLIRRLAEKGTILDSELRCTREVAGPQSVLLSSILPQRGFHTLVGQAGRQRIVGQFRVRDERIAQIVYIAPELPERRRDTAWLHLIDAMAVEAGKRGVHMLMAEVDEDSPLFVTMRTAGFAVYARQDIWKREPAALPFPFSDPAELRESKDEDINSIQALYGTIVPRLVQPVAMPPEDSLGFVYRHDQRLQGYVTVSMGKTGIYVTPLLHPDILYRDAITLLAGVLGRIGRVDRLPVYICVRRYQDWLEDALTELGFVSCQPQALMVRHIAAGVRQAAFSSLERSLEAMPNAVRPPTRSSIRFDRTGEKIPTLWNGV